jgi:amidase
VVEPAKPDFSPEAVWNAWRTLRGWQAGSSLVELYNDPHKRALLKPEAQWEVEQGLKVTAFDVTKASTVRTAWYHAVRQLFEAYDFLVLPSTQVFRSRSNGAGRRRSPGGPWTPTTAGWRS